MGIGERIVAAIEQRQKYKRKRRPGPIGDFYRNGGNDQLYNVPVATDDLVIDAGGYHGEWTAQMLSRYGCQSEVFEPVQEFADHCKRLFARNARVRVHAAALGGSDRTTRFSLAANGTSEIFATSKRKRDSIAFDATVCDIEAFLERLGHQPIGCLKLNIEGGEYEVLERLLDTHKITRIKSLLIQFHRQPECWATRRELIIERLRATHDQAWCYPMVWEKWLIR